MAKIAIFHNLPSGGGKRALYEWTRRLSKNHTIDVYTLSTADHDFCDLRPYTRYYQIRNFYPRRLFKSPLGRLNQLQRWRDLLSLEYLNRLIADQINLCGYDVVFANTCMFTFIPSLVKYLTPPSIYYLHEPFGQKFIRATKRSYIIESKWRNYIDRIDPFLALYKGRLSKIQHESIKSARLLLANSCFTQSQMKKMYGIDAPVAYLGVNTTDFKPLPIQREMHLLSVGELSPRKGFDFLIESLALLPEENRPALRLAANQDSQNERSYLEELAQQKGVQLHFLFRLKTEQLAAEYNKARFLVYSPILEPFGLVPLEAMACGTPVVAVAEGGVMESVVNNQTGFLVERNQANFANAILTLLENPGLANTFGENGRGLVLQKWGWEHSTAAIERFLISFVH